MTVLLTSLMIYLADPTLGDILGWSLLGALMFSPVILVIGYGYGGLVNLLYVIYYNVWRSGRE